MRELLEALAARPDVAVCLVTGELVCCAAGQPGAGRAACRAAGAGAAACSACLPGAAASSMSPRPAAPRIKQATWSPLDGPRWRRSASRASSASPASAASQQTTAVRAWPAGWPAGWLGRGGGVVRLRPAMAASAWCLAVCAPLSWLPPPPLLPTRRPCQCARVLARPRRVRAHRGGQVPEAPGRWGFRGGGGQCGEDAPRCTGGIAHTAPAQCQPPLSSCLQAA